MTELIYSDRNTRVKNLRVKLLRRTGVGRQIEVEVLESWSHSYHENGQGIIKEFHRGQVVHVDATRCQPVRGAK